MIANLTSTNDLEQLITLRYLRSGEDQPMYENTINMTHISAREIIPTSTTNFIKTARGRKGVRFIRIIYLRTCESTTWTREVPFVLSRQTRAITHLTKNWKFSFLWWWRERNYRFPIHLGVIFRQKMCLEEANLDEIQQDQCFRLTSVFLNSCRESNSIKSFSITDLPGTSLVITEHIPRLSEHGLRR